MQLSDPVIRGIGEKTQAGFVSAGIDTVSRLLHYFPRDYIKTAEIRAISSVGAPERITLQGKIIGGVSMYRRGGKSLLSFKLSDGSGVAQVTYFNMPYLRNQLRPGREMIVNGTAQLTGGQIRLTQPLILSREAYEEAIRTLQPVYPLHGELTASRLRSAMREAMPAADQIVDYLPEEIRRKEDLLPIRDAIRKMHFPKSMEEVYEARRRLAFDEFFLFFFRMQILQRPQEKLSSSFVIGGSQKKAALKFLEALPFSLTGAQRRTVEDILADMGSGDVMNRLVQGDVGSGKTVVAFAAALAAVSAGYQAAIMAPTEVLAAQHYANIIKLTQQLGLPFRAELLTGSVKASEKRRIKEAIADARCDLVIGTHALLQEDVSFASLALVITDEQHRFGVGQRMTLMQKDERTPHVLVMSATPIPRTLGLILYGDLDVSLIDELPASRLPVQNSVVDTSYRTRIWQFILKRISEGRQAYIICPMVEASENDDGSLCNVKDYSEELAEKVPSGVRVAMLHGSMRPADKNGVMERFAAGEIDILVSTTVVEVGVNVPNATVMVVENAERFGLSQLHQLRGRVGRGEWQSYCIFVAGESGSEKTMERLKVLESTTDGFRIAEEDLKQRGPGDFFGFRQSGDPYFKIADIYDDAEVLTRAKRVSEEMLKEKPEILELIREKMAENADLDLNDFHVICL